MEKDKIKKNILFRNIVVTGILLLSLGIVTAQEKGSILKNGLSVYVKGGVNYFHYNLESRGERNNRFAPGIGIEYLQCINNSWSISGGLEYQRYSSKATLSAFNDQFATTDNEGADFVFKYSAGSYTEEHWVNMLNIPIRVQYETTTGNKNNLYASAGFQFGIPLESKYSGTFSNLKTTGYYEQWDVELGSPAFMGFGSWGDKQYSDIDMKVKNNYALLFEVGIKHKLNNRHGLYAGLYSDLGLNNLFDSESSLPLLSYDANNPTEFGSQSVLNASPQARGNSYAGKVKTIGLGLKLRYVFSIKEKSGSKM